ncbi:hypothetical protein VTN02DRAFT_5620 [Thermoascus thermophilus]
MPSFEGKGKQYSREEWDKLVDEFGALSNTAVLMFAEDLVEAYAEAKVILDAESQGSHREPRGLDG